MIQSLRWPTCLEKFLIILLTRLHKLSLKYRVFIKYCGFSLKFSDFSELCKFCCSAGVLLPAWCVYTHWNRWKTEKGKSSEYFKIFEKSTIFNKTPCTYNGNQVPTAECLGPFWQPKLAFHFQQRGREGKLLKFSLYIHINTLIITV